MCAAVGSLGVGGGYWGPSFLNTTTPAPCSPLGCCREAPVTSSTCTPNPRVTAKNHTGAEKGLSNDNETAQAQAKVLITS